MSKITAGQKALDFTFNTVFENDLTLSEEVKKAKKTFLIFLRYFGCRMCQIDMAEYTEEYDRIKEKDAQILVVLQSTQQSMKDQTKPEDLPYSVICDPEQKLYQLYTVEPAPSKEEMSTPESKARVEREAAKRGLVHGAYEGNELQLPACFLLDPEMNVLYAHYGTNVGDIPLVDDLVALL